jgi:hypothetical protein
MGYDLLAGTTSETCHPEQSSKHSMIYNALPTLVRNRIPALPSIRRTVGSIRARSISTKSLSEDLELEDPLSPPPGYRSRPSSSASTELSRFSLTSVDDTTLQEDALDRTRSSIGTPSPLYAFTPTPPGISEGRTGINWRYANQGMVALAYRLVCL